MENVLRALLALTPLSDELPPIDRDLPKKIETATFALG